MPKKLKVLHIVNGLGLGGAETWLLQMVKRNQGKLQFDFFLTGGVEQELDSEFRALGCKLHYFKFSWNKIFSFAREFRKTIREEKYSIIHDHEDFAAGWHWLFLLFQLPALRICHAHNSMVYIKNYANSLSRKVFYYTGKILNGLLATHITGTSEQLMRELGYDGKMYKNKRIESLYCGAAPDTFKYDEAMHMSIRGKLGFAKQHKVVIFIGRIGLTRENEINHKNPEFAFAIARELAAHDSDFKFLFVGEKGILGASIEKELKSLGLENNIILTGKRKDVDQLLLAADLMLFTSTIEPFGLVLIEAQFSCLPIVASDIITRETIVLPELFYLLDISKADQIEWTAAIRSFFASGFNREKFSKEHEEEINHSIFTIDSSYQRLLRAYHTSNHFGVQNERTRIYRTPN
jgi:glycosyltransferase EpsF